MLFTAKLMKSYMNNDRITRKYMMFINSRLIENRCQEILFKTFNIYIYVYMYKKDFK